MSVLDTLITDRTNGDVQDRNDKGTYNATDINRVNNAAVYLADEAMDMLTDLEAYRESMGVANAPIFRPYTAEDVAVELPVIEGTASRLPEGYTELEYIEKSGDPFINTGFVPDSLSRMTMQIAVFSYSDWSAPYGARNTSAGTDSASSTLFISQQAIPRCDYYGSSLSLPEAIPLGEKITIDLNKNVISINGQTHTFSPITASSAYPWFLMDVNTGGSPRGSGHFRLYSCQIYDNESPARDYIPCKNPSAVVGLYDAVGQQFYANAGTGIFTAGPEVPITPPRTTWQREDIPNPSKMTQYLANITNLRGLLPITGPEVPTDMEGLTYQEANDIEEILLLVAQAIQDFQANAEEQIDYIGTYANQLVSGTFYAGNYRTLQHFSRGR